MSSLPSGYRTTMGNASEQTALLHSMLKRGDYHHGEATDIRSPCPLINTLANHGYINRDGRNITASQLNAAMNDVGLSTALGAFFARPIFNEHQDAKSAFRQQPGLLSRLWAFLRNPWILLSIFGLRKRGQVDIQGRKVLNLDQLAIPGVIEHDISLCRRDHQQRQGNLVLQQDLVKDLLACSSDGGKTLTLEDLAALRLRRIQTQLDQNPAVVYDNKAHTIGCTEISLVLDLIGNGKSVPCSYAKAFFQEERFPVKEGWKKRRIWTLGFLELFGTVSKVKAAVGLTV